MRIRIFKFNTSANLQLDPKSDSQTALLLQILNRMPQPQSVINFTALLLATVSLYYISGQIAREGQSIRTAVDLTNHIAREGSLQDSDIDTLKTLLAQPQEEEFDSSPLCFLKAYEQIVIKSQLGPANLFLLFEQSRHEYDNLKTCAHYHSLLIYRANSLQTDDKPKILSILATLQKDRFDSQHGKTDKQSHICVYFHTDNSEAHIKQQIKRLTAQDYANFNIQIQDDASTDNSHIIAKYTVEQMPSELISKIKVQRNTQKSGFLTHFEEFLSDNCQQNSVVLLLAQSELLISSNSFDLLNRMFGQQTTKLAFFRSMTTPHLNADNNQIMANGTVTAVVSPVLAFRKSQYAQVSAVLKEKGKSGDYLGIERELLSYHLLKNEPNPSATRIIDEILVERSENKDTTRQQRVQNLVNALFQF